MIKAWKETPCPGIGGIGGMRYRSLQDEWHSKEAVHGRLEKCSTWKKLVHWKRRTFSNSPATNLELSLDSSTSMG